MTTNPTQISSQPSSPDQPQISASLLLDLRGVPLLASMSDTELAWFAGVPSVDAPEGSVLVATGEASAAFWILLEGAVSIIEETPGGEEVLHYTYPAGSTFGEVPLLAGIPSTSTLRVAVPSRLLRLDEAGFWHLMNESLAVRQAILRNLALRLQKMQYQTIHQEKMAALGTMAAGLMHELNNPGAAARRAAGQLRDDLIRMQQFSEHLREHAMSDPQRACLSGLQQRGLAARVPVHLNSIEQSDAEELLAEWLETSSVKDSWTLAPALASIGFTASDLSCARHQFSDKLFHDALSWLEALVSTSQRISTIEESLSRVVELVKAVKTYAYEGSGQIHSIDVNQSIQATLVILGHKLREKQIHLDRDLAPALPPLSCFCKGLNQVWTNLLDNAIDAAEPGGHISVKTWVEPQANESSEEAASSLLCISITDDGAGIPPEMQAHIFDPFFTTKAVGIGTGLGLGIASRLIEQSHGSLHFSSQPGNTAFHVRLPVATPATTA